MRAREEQHAQELAEKQAQQAAALEAQQERMLALEAEIEESTRTCDKYANASQEQALEHQQELEDLQESHEAEVRAKEASFAASVDALIRNQSAVQLSEVHQEMERTRAIETLEETYRAEHDTLVREHQRELQETRAEYALEVQATEELLRESQNRTELRKTSGHLRNT